MNSYSIFHKVKTLAEICKPFTHKGFKFQQWDFTIANGPKGDVWIVNKILKADNFSDAINNFRKNLFNIIERCSFVSQCYFSFLPESWLVIKKDSNPKNIFFLRYTKERKGVGLHFDRKKINSLKNLQSFLKDPVFNYLAESIRSRSFYSRLAMLIITLESIAGEREPNKTDKEFIKNKILKDEQLFDEIFKFGSGIRNKIFHGKEIGINGDYIDKIYRKIVKYFNLEYNTHISLEVKHPQRTFEENYEEIRGFFKPKREGNIEFKEVIEKFNEDTNINSPIPDDYEYVPKVKNYYYTLQNF